MFIKTLAFLPVVLCLVTAAKLNSKPEVGPSLLRQDSFGNGKHYDARKFTRSSVDSKKSAAVSSSPQGKSSENKPGYSQVSENDSLDVASWSSEVVSSAPAYGSIGTAGQASSGRSFAGNQGGLGGFGPSSFGSTGFGKNSGGAGSYGGQGGSFGGQSGSYGGSQSGYNGASQGGSYGGSQGGSYGGSQGGSYGGSQGGSYGGSQSGYSGASQGGYGNNVEPGMPYRFQYNVNEYGNNFGHSQASDGNQVTGRYFVQLPDGRLQTVDFKADPLSGYTADVQYEGQAQYASNSGSGAGSYSSGAGGYSSGAGSNSGGYGGVGGGSLGQLPLAFQGDFGGTSGGYSGPGSFGSKPY